MFAPPPVIPTRAFTRIPETFYRTGTCKWLDVQMHGAQLGVFLEGPSFDLDGNLWVTDVPWGRIFKITPDGTVTLACEYDGEPNGLKFHKDGRAFVADHKNGIMVLDPKTGRIEPFLQRPGLRQFIGPNDLIFASNGDLYFTDQGQTGFQDPSGRLYRLRPSGQLDLLLSNIPSPNGLVLTPDERTLLLCVTRDNAIWRVPLMRDGTVSKVGAFIRMSGGTGPDGCAIDEQGNIAICHVGLGVVWLMSPIGEPLHRIQTCAGLATTNCAYGGPDNKTLYITESRTGTILMADMPVPGRRMYSHM